jgi:mercuric reductase
LVTATTPVSTSKSPFFKVAIEEKDDLVAALRQRNYQNVLASLDGVTFLEAQAKFAGPNQVEAGGQIYEADKIIIATGASAKPLSVDGFDTVKWHTNRTIMDIKKASSS